MDQPAGFGARLARAVLALTVGRLNFHLTHVPD
jgi:hypothetical protein